MAVPGRFPNHGDRTFPAFPANDELLLKSLERTAIEAVRFNGGRDPVLSG